MALGWLGFDAGRVGTLIEEHYRENPVAAVHVEQDAPWSESSHEGAGDR